MNSVVDFFKKDSGKTSDRNMCLSPNYYDKNLVPPVFENKGFESDRSQRERFQRLDPVTVLFEVADAVGGKVTRVDEFDENSTPIVFRETPQGFVSIVFYKKLMRFTIYVSETYKSDTASKKTITHRRTLYGLQKAIEMIDAGEYNTVFDAAKREILISKKGRDNARRN